MIVEKRNVLPSSFNCATEHVFWVSITVKLEFDAAFFGVFLLPCPRLRDAFRFVFLICFCIGCLSSFWVSDAVSLPAGESIFRNSIPPCDCCYSCMFGWCHLIKVRRKVSTGFHFPLTVGPIESKRIMPPRIAASISAFIQSGMFVN